MFSNVSGVHASVQAAREISANQQRLILPEHRVGPDMLRVASLDVTTGQVAPVQTGGFMVDPSLSPDGRFAAGYTYQTGARGPLTLRNLETGEQFRLSQPAAVWDTKW